MGSAGGPAGTTGLTSASWYGKYQLELQYAFDCRMRVELFVCRWNHGDTTKVWQQNLAAVQSLAEVEVRKPKVSSGGHQQQHAVGKKMPAYCAPFC